jgi:hypothetical protein
MAFTGAVKAPSLGTQHIREELDLLEGEDRVCDFPIDAGGCV